MAICWMYHYIYVERRIEREREKNRKERGWAYEVRHPAILFV